MGQRLIVRSDFPKESFNIQDFNPVPFTFYSDLVVHVLSLFFEVLLPRRCPRCDTCYCHYQI